jgi:hypothetical protein
MKTFKSTRKVQAAKIRAISAQELGAVIYFDVPPTEKVDRVAVDRAYVQKHNPQAGGYFVQYGDGYQSYCPAEAFERDHQEDDGTTLGLPVPGYRPQGKTQLDLVAAMKTREELILRELDCRKLDPDIDQRWLALGRTHLEIAFMAINRAVFKPARVTFPEDTEQAGLFVGEPATTGD